MNQELIVGVYWLILLFFMTISSFFIKNEFRNIYRALFTVLILMFLLFFNKNEDREQANTTQIERSVETDENNTSTAQENN
ncbi:hypothetical protein AAEX37_01093 [Oligella sp. MSHR50489EDL]|uniref:hypothetical protein n=2 Tax=Oligella sp. MSHR50489EDL TaxID=3139409 RepID=UPI003D8184C3